MLSLVTTAFTSSEKAALATCFRTLDLMCLADGRERGRERKITVLKLQLHKFHSKLLIFFLEFSSKGISCLCQVADVAHVVFHLKEEQQSKLDIPELYGRDLKNGKHSVPKAQSH